MPIETILTKRKALHRGEIGFFPTSQIAEQDIATVQMNNEVMCTFRQPRNLQHLKFLWLLAQTIADNTDYYLDKDDAMEDLKLRVGFSKFALNSRTKQFERRAKSLSRASNETLIQLKQRMIETTCRDLIPGMQPGPLTAEIEKLLT